MGIMKILYLLCIRSVQAFATDLYILVLYYRTIYKQPGRCSCALPMFHVKLLKDKQRVFSTPYGYNMLASANCMKCKGWGQGVGIQRASAELLKELQNRVPAPGGQPK